MHRPTAHDPYRATALMAPQLDDRLPYLQREGPLRVAAVVDRYPPWVNAGAEWMLHSILRRLVENGHECRVSTALPDGVEVPTSVNGVEVWPYDGATELAEWCDVLVGHLLWTREIVKLASDADKPLMYLLHNDRQVQHWNLSANNITVLVPNSEWVGRSSIDAGWLGPMFVCRPPVFCADYAMPSRRPRGDVVTLVNPIPEKGRDLFNELARRMYRTKFLAVKGAYGSPYRLPHYLNNVEFIQPTPNMRDDVYAKDRRFMLVPSEYESWGRVAVEAMAAGVPVIAHPTPGLIEACGDAAQFIDREDVPMRGRPRSRGSCDRRGLLARMRWRPCWRKRAGRPGGRSPIVTCWSSSRWMRACALRLSRCRSGRMNSRRRAVARTDRTGRPHVRLRAGPSRPDAVNRGAPSIVADDPNDGPFNRGRALNAGVSESDATCFRADVLVLHWTPT
jgi:hypothetical protein